MKKYIADTLSIAAAVFVAMLCLAIETRADYCKSYVDPEQTLSSRVLFLSGGNAWDLFQKYLAEAEKNKIKLSLWGGVKVVLNDGKGKKEITTTSMEKLSMEGSKERWKKKLDKINAVGDPSILGEAEQMKWDVICIGQAKPSDTKNKQPGKASADTASSAGVPLEAKQNFQQAMQYASRKDFNNAIKEFTNAIQSYPAYAAAYSNRGVAYMQQKKMDLAEDDLKKAVELAPKDANNHYNLACWYSISKQAGKGLIALEAAFDNGFNDYASLRKDPDLANLRKSADWQNTLEKHKIFLAK